MTMILDIAQVRRMVAEPTEDTYTDATVSGYIVAASNDLNAVAGEIWAEKASSLQATSYDFQADNASYHLSQVIDSAVKQAKYYNSRRLSTSSLWVKSPVEASGGVAL